MVVNEDDVVNIMGGMENAGGIKLNDHKRKLKNRFEICRKLGQGTYGKVQLGINKETGQEVAIKTIKKSKIETEADLIRIRREIQIMSSVHHPHIIHIYEVFENKEKMVLVMEIAAGGELYDYLSDRKCLDDKEARRLFRQIALATYYCHKNNICHRDLKLENILLDENGSAKIADFGLSNVYDGKNLLSTFCGSPLYASPEIVKGCPYKGPEVDCWSLGVLLYTLVYGAMPFDGSNFKRLVKQITTGDYYEPKKPSSASSLIRRMLTVKPEERANIQDICSHWWVNEGYEKSCLDEAEALASLTPVRLDLLLSLNQSTSKDAVVVQQTEEEPQPTQPEKPSRAMSIVELSLDDSPSTVVNDDLQASMRVSEPPDDVLEKNQKRKFEGETNLENDVDAKASRRDALKIESSPMVMIQEPMELSETSSKSVNGFDSVKESESQPIQFIEESESEHKHRERSKTPRARAPSPEGRDDRSETGKDNEVSKTRSTMATDISPNDSGIVMTESPKQMQQTRLSDADVKKSKPSIPNKGISTEELTNSEITSTTSPSKPVRHEITEVSSAKMEKKCVQPVSVTVNIENPVLVQSSPKKSELKDVEFVPKEKLVKESKLPSAKEEEKCQNNPPVLKLSIPSKPMEKNDKVPETAPPVLTFEKPSENQRGESTQASPGSKSPPTPLPTSGASTPTAGLMKPEKQRDSKVMKAAQYWNSYIGDFMEKTKSPPVEQVKSLEKPKKIANAGVGSKGLSDLKNAFENPKPKKIPDDKLVIMRRNSRKLNIEGCNPGLKVNDAKSVFEVKNKPTPPPPLIRRNSVNNAGSSSSSTSPQPRWIKPKPGESEAISGPFGTSPTAKISTKPREIAQPSLEKKAPEKKTSSAVKSSEAKDNKSNKKDALATSSTESKPSKPATSPKPKLKKASAASDSDATKKESKKKVKEQGGEVITKAPITEPSPKVNFIKRNVELAAFQPKVPNRTIESIGKVLFSPIKPEKTFIQSQKNKRIQEAAGLISKQLFKNELKPPTDKESKSVPNTPLEFNKSAKGPETFNSRSYDVTQSLPTSPETQPQAAQADNSLFSNVGDLNAIAAAVTGTTVPKDNSSSVPEAPPLPVLQQKVAIVPKIKTINPETEEPNSKLEAVKSSLKRVPHAPAMGKKVEDDKAETIDLVLSEGRRGNRERTPSVGPPNKLREEYGSVSSVSANENSKDDASLYFPDTKSKEGTADFPSSLPTSKPHGSVSAPDLKKKERFIPIKVESPREDDNTSSRSLKIDYHGRPPPAASSSTRSLPRKKNEHYIPIKVEGKGTLIPSESTPQNLGYEGDHSGSLSRNRWGSRKKRSGGSTYSDSSGVSDDESAFSSFGPFGGLQKYSSLGKHGLENAPMFRLRKIRPTFALQRSQSGSSGEEDDDFDEDDGFREMTAENLFSTLLSRVKSLTKRIHEEHEQHMNWQQNQRGGNRPINSGSGRLERSALRNSIKRNQQQQHGNGPNPPTGFYSRQSSLRDDGTSSLRSFDGGPAERDREFPPPFGGGSSSSRSLLRDFQPMSPPGRPFSPQAFENTFGDAEDNLDSLEKQRLKALHRQFSNELQNIENDIFQASLNKLKREAAERSADLSDLSDAGGLYGEETESISSDIFGDFDDLNERKRKRGTLMRLDEDSEMGPHLPSDSLRTNSTLLGRSGTRSKPVTRRSISRELIPEERRRQTGAKPVAHRSVSRELFDVDFKPGGSSLGRMKREMDDIRQQMSARERSMSRDFEQMFGGDSGHLFPDHLSPRSQRSGSASRHIHQNGGFEPSGNPSRPRLSTQGRSMTQNELGRNLRTSPLMFNRENPFDSDFGRPDQSFRPGGASSLEDRSRQNWRRISVPERGKDFKSLPRKYNNRYSAIYLDSASSPLASPHYTRPSFSATLTPCKRSSVYLPRQTSLDLKSSRGVESYATLPRRPLSRHLSIDVPASYF